ncbi:MAG: hypothetical protein JWL65_5841, partial [Gammaproteobacteria bacterium]|nr:hypothetical protein [Gammaproteobacteria bacterium]
RARVMVKMQARSLAELVRIEDRLRGAEASDSPQRSAE